MVSSMRFIYQVTVHQKDELICQSDAGLLSANYKGRRKKPEARESCGRDPSMFRAQREL